MRVPFLCPCVDNYHYDSYLHKATPLYRVGLKGGTGNVETGIEEMWK